MSKIPIEPAEIQAPPPDDARPDPDSQKGERVVSLPTADIAPNRFQPRRSFDDDAIASLAASIAATGLIQPIAVRAAPAGAPRPWEIVAGERRWRAAGLTAIARIPTIVVELSDQEAAEWALVENIQREDLNAMERAWGLRRLRDRFGLTQSEVAARVGMDRSSVANHLRLTDLEEEIQESIAGGALGAGHGKALLAAPAGHARTDLAQRAAREGWSVRRLESAARKLARGEALSDGARAEAPDNHTARAAIRADLERRASEALGTKVAIQADRTGKKGVLRVAYFDLEHLDAILLKLGVRADD